MAQTVGWRSFWWLNVALNTLAFLTVLVGFPETKWHRDRHVQPAKVERHPDLAEEKKSFKIGHESYNPASAGLQLKNEPYLSRGRPNRSQWLLLQPKSNALTSLGHDFYLPWKLFSYPIVQFASFVVSFSSACSLLINLTQSQTFAAPPYNFAPLSVGFTNFASMVGALIGLFTAGPASDWIASRLTRKNKGIREPEIRLLVMVPYVCIMILGNFVVAFGFQHHWNWKVRKPCSV